MPSRYLLVATLLSVVTAISASEAIEDTLQRGDDPIAGLARRRPDFFRFRRSAGSAGLLPELDFPRGVSHYVAMNRADRPGAQPAGDPEPSTPVTREEPVEIDWLSERLASSPRLRHQLAELLVDDFRAAHQVPWWRRLAPLLASVSSAAVVLVAFLIPSVQDQWDRYQSRQVVQDYAELGRGFARASRYRQAEQAFAKAIEMSEGRRIDLERERLEARVQLMSLEPAWGVDNPEGLEEGDFLYLLQFQERAGDADGSSRTLASYADFLAADGRIAEAESVARRAVANRPDSSRAYVSLGNALSELDRVADAEAAYVRALQIDPANASAHYDLGLLYAAAGRTADAESALDQAARLAPADHVVLAELAAQLARAGKLAAAAQVQARLDRLESGRGGRPPRAP